MHWFDDSALTLAAFIPLVGLALVLLIPGAKEQAIKVTALTASITCWSNQYAARAMGPEMPATMTFSYSASR